MNSTELAQLLVQRNFASLSEPTRTKAHGYKHPLMTNPIYVKIGGKRGALTPASSYALVLHPEDGAAVERDRPPPGVHIASAPYKSAGLLAFRTSDGSTNWGRDVDVTDEPALDALLARLGLRGLPQSATAHAAQVSHEHENAEQQSRQPFSPYELAAATAELAAEQQAAGVDETTRERLALARLGQGAYRQRMMALWGGRCAVTGCGTPQALIASHSKPWADSSNHERLDEYNGLLLTASIDRLFDQGLIAFSDDGWLLHKPSINENDMRALGLPREARLRFVAEKHKRYLADHRRRHGF